MLYARVLARRSCAPERDLNVLRPKDPVLIFRLHDAVLRRRWLKRSCALRDRDL